MFPKFGFRTHTTGLWPVEQSSFCCPVARQNFSFLATALDCDWHIGLQALTVTTPIHHPLSSSRIQAYKPSQLYPPPPAWSIFLMLYRFYKLTETEQSAANTAYETCCVFTAIARLVSSHSGRHKTSAKGRYSRQGLMLPSRLCELLFWWQPFCTSWKGP